MKKILAIAIVAVFALALCLSASAQVSLDRLVINATTLTPDDETNLRNADEVKINKGDKLYILGWALNAETNSNLKEVVYTLDGKEVKCADNYRDRPGLTGAIGVANSELDTHAGIGKDDATFELTGIDKLGDGTYKVVIVCKYEDGTTENLKEEFTLVVGTGVKSDDPGEQSAPKAAFSVDAAKLGDLWDNNKGANQVDAVKGDGFVTFTASGGDPFFAFAEPLQIGADAKYAVVKYRTSSNVNTIDFYLQIAEPHAQSDKLVNDGEWHFIVVDLSKPFPDSMGDSLWDGTLARLDPMTGDLDNASIDIASIDFFTSEADAQAAANGGQPSNPGTADASVIAIAAVACIALAGVVVAKKVR